MTDQITAQDIREMFADKKFTYISLIKELRTLKGEGLRVCKDAVDACRKKPQDKATRNQNDFDLEKIIETFVDHGMEPEFHELEKEEFMNILEEAIDASGKLHFNSMLDAVMVTCKNIKSNGGLEEIAKQRAKFLNAI